MAGENGSVEIPIKLINAEAIAQAKATEQALKQIDLKSEAKTHALELAKSLDKVESITKQTISATNSMSVSNKKLSTSEKEAAEAARKQITEQNNLKNSLKTSASYYDKLAQGMESANLKSSSNVAKLKSVKAELGATKIETAQAKAEWERLSASEGENAASTLAAKNKFADLIGTESKLTIETANLERQVGGLSPKMALSADKAGIMSERFTTAGERISAVGSKMTMGVTLPIVGGLTASTAAATKFDNEIKSMGALLDDGSVSSQTLKAQLDNLGSASKKWSVQYGISTSSINDGMSELIKKGYTYNQTLGAMPSILDASKASGEDFNDVMSVSTSTLEQFGLKSNNTAKMLKNTQRVTDSLTFVANKTSAGFSDMGYAMQYVGPVAHGLGISLEQTSAMIGEMSNQGIEGQKAGTSLRGALTSLLNPSAQNAEGFKKLGVSIKDFKSGSLTMPDILDKIKESTKGMTKAQKQAALAQAFGTEAQSGMNILVSQGGDELRKLTKETQNATGYTHDMAKDMNSTSKAHIDQFKQSLHVLAITFGSQLMPEVTKFVKEGTKLVEWFSNLDEGTQQAIIKTGLFVAAMGPVASIVGKTSSAIGGLYGGYQKLVLFAGKGKSEIGVLSEILDTVKGSATGAVPALEETATGMASAATGAESAAGSVGIFGGALGTALPIIGSVALAVGAGYAAWKLWGEGAWNSAQRTSRWGSDVGEAADKSLTKMQNFNAQATSALNNFGAGAVVNGSKASKAFKNMGDEIENVGKKANKNLENSFKDLPANVQVVVQSSVQEQEKGNNKVIENSRTLSKNVAGILKTRNNDIKKLSSEQRTYIENSQQKLNENEIKLLNIGGKKKAAVMKALNGDVRGLTEKQAQTTIDTLQKGITKEQSVYEKNRTNLKKMYKDNQIDKSTYNKALEQLDDDHKNSLDKNLGAISQIEDKYNAAHTGDLDTLMAKENITWDQVEKRLKKSQTTHKETLSSIAQEYGNVTKVQKKAGEDWNKMVLDPKTGEIKTNAQETLDETAKTKDGWKQLLFDAKHAKINSDAKKMIKEALEKNGVWNGLSFDDKTAVVGFKGDDKISKVLKEFGIWDQLTPKEKELVASGDESPIVNLMMKIGEWNQLSTKEKTAMVKDKGTVPLMDIMDKMNIWNGLPEKEKNAVINAKGASQLADITIKYGMWNQLPEKEKKLLMNDSDARTKLINAGILQDEYNLNNPKKKKLTAENKDLVNKMNAGAKATDLMNGKKNPHKTATANTFDHDRKMKSSQNLINHLNNTKNPFKRATTNNSQHDKGMDKSIDVIGQMNKTKNPSKTATVNHKSVSEAHSAWSSFMDSWNSVGSFLSKTFNIKTKGGHHATGTNDAPGGLSILGDGGRSEPYLMPDGTFGVSPATDTMIPLMQHSKVWPSISAFNSEIKAKNSQLSNVFSYTPEQLGTVKMNAPVSTVLMQQQGNNQSMNELKELITQLANKDISINVSVAGETVLEKLYPLFKDKLDMDMLLQIIKSGGNANV